MTLYSLNIPRAYYISFVIPIITCWRVRECHEEMFDNVQCGVEAASCVLPPVSRYICNRVFVVRFGC